MASFDLTEITLNALRSAGLTSYDFVTICTSCRLAFIDGIEGGANNELCDTCNQKENN